MSSGAVVVGVVPGQPIEVVTVAAQFAEHFAAELVCEYVDRSSYPVETRADGTVLAAPIDPDVGDEEAETFDPELAQALSTALARHAVRWSTRALAGGVAPALAHLADDLDASMIVVGTRDAGLRASVQEFFAGSVAVHLAHRQHRPLVVVPLSPVTGDDALPWQGGRDE